MADSLHPLREAISDLGRPPSELHAGEPSARSSERAATPLAQVLAFRAGPWRFVVDVQRVVCVLSERAMAAAPLGRSDQVYLAWHGEAVPVLSLTSLLAPAGQGVRGTEGKPPAQNADDAIRAEAGASPARERVLLLQTARGLAGLRIEEAEQVMHLEPGACLRAEQANSAPSAWCLGLCELRGQLYGLFDVRALAACLP